MGNADVIFLPLYDKKGLDSVAIYSIAMVLISFLQIPSRSMIAPTVPVLARAIEANDYSKARQVFSRSSINILIATLCMAIIITCNLKNVVLLIKNGYDDVVPVFLILLIGRFADLATGLNDAVMSITKYYRFNVILSFILVPVLVLLFKFLVPLYGIFGAAWSTTVVYFVFNICKYAFVKIKLKMDPFSLDTIKTLLAGIPTLLAGYFLPALSYPIFDAIFRTGVICFVYLCLLFILKPSADLHIYLVSVKEKKKIF
jgi:O-antigen/teichoic acid export membrane protein